MIEVGTWVSALHLTNWSFGCLICRDGRLSTRYFLAFLQTITVAQLNYCISCLATDKEVLERSLLSPEKYLWTCPCSHVPCFGWFWSLGSTCILMHHHYWVGFFSVKVFFKFSLDFCIKTPYFQYTAVQLRHKVHKTEIALKSWKMNRIVCVPISCKSPKPSGAAFQRNSEDSSQ